MGCYGDRGDWVVNSYLRETVLYLLWGLDEGTSQLVYAPIRPADKAVSRDPVMQRVQICLCNTEARRYPLPSEVPGLPRDIPV